MAISNTNLLQTNKPLSLPLLAFITMIFLMLLNRVNSADSLYFTFDKFDPDPEDLILQGDATIESSTKVLQLTKTGSNSTVGRALYCAPVRLWESSAVVVSFDTTFKFVISSQPSNQASTPDEVLSFFIASPNTTIPHPGKFVAVKFHPYPDVEHGNPSSGYIQVDTNSGPLPLHCPWGWQDEVPATAYISYNSVSKTLGVVSTYPNGEPVPCPFALDLNDYLPEWVRVGFSGNSTGQVRHTNSILSWSFRSSLKSNYEVKEKDTNSAKVVRFE